MDEKENTTEKGLDQYGSYGADAFGSDGNEKSGNEQPGYQQPVGGLPYPQNPYGQATYPQNSYRQNEKTEVQIREQDNLALASMIMGILGVVTSCCCYIGIIFSCLGIIFAMLSKKGEKFKGTALAGLILSIVGMVLMVIFAIVLFGLNILGGAY